MIKARNILSKEIVFYIIAVILCCVFLSWILQLWSADLRIPFDYHQDALMGGASIKGTIETGWYNLNPSIGVPHGSQMLDFPGNGNLDVLLIKLISVVFPNWAMTMNLYYLLTFPLVTISALFVFRKLKISPILSIAGSLLFTFLPYHFLQGEPHINLAAYYLIPLIVLICLWLYEDDFSLKLFERSSGKPGGRVNRRTVISIIVCIAMGSSFIYYPFFAAFFLVVAGAGAAISKKKWRPLFNALALIGIMLLVIIAWNAPTLLYQHRNGPNTFLTRDPLETEVFGLKIVQLLIPISGNNNPFLAMLADKYDYTAPFVNENASAALGIIGSIGFILLVVWMFYRVFKPSHEIGSETFARINRLSGLNIAGVILGVVGGLGTLLAYLLFPEIRTYTRISVFLAFFAFLAILLVADYLISKTSFSKITIFGLVAVVLLFGINDQTSSKFVPDYQGIKSEFQNDQHFVDNIEKTYPADQMIFQLPYVPFPEAAPQYKSTYYDLFRGYLHSTDIKWSYGAMKGRFGDFWESNISAKPADEMIKELSLSGFNGIWVDGYGYADGGKETAVSIGSILKTESLTSDNGRFYYFDMTPYNAGLKSALGAEKYLQESRIALNPLYVQFGGGFLSQAEYESSDFRICSARGEIAITNFLDNPRTVVISGSFLAGESTIRIESPKGVETLNMNDAAHPYSEEYVIPPGKYLIKLDCDGPSIYVPRIQKDVVFGIEGFKIVEETP